MQTNIPPHAVDPNHQYYYQAMTPHVAGYPLPSHSGYYHHHPDHYMVASGQPQSQHLVMPVPQQPLIIMAPPTGVYRQSSYYPPHPAHPMYYREMSTACPTSGNGGSHDASVRPLMTSTPLPPECCPRYPSVPYGSQSSNGRADADLIADFSKISIGSPDETICDVTLPTPSECKIVQQQKQQQHQQQQQSRHELPSNYKTKMCSNYANTGHCGMGNRCLFAHGEEELRGTTDVQLELEPELNIIGRNLKYKTRLCRNIYPNNRNSKCPYGNRCEFLHPGDPGYANVVAAAGDWKRRDNFGGRQQHHRGWASRGARADVTPENHGEFPGANVISRSAAKPEPEKIMLMSRNVVGSMMSLNRPDCEFSRTRLAPFQRPLQPARSVLNLPKFERRRSISQLNLAAMKRSNSLEFVARR